MKLYLDGVLIGENAFTGGLTANREPIVIGGSNRTNRNDSGDLDKLKIIQPFNGFIDEVAVYGQALTAGQIGQSMAQGALRVSEGASSATQNDAVVPASAPWVRDFVLNLAENPDSSDNPNANISVALPAAVPLA